MLPLPSLPVDIRHNAKIARAALAGWAEAVLAGTLASNGDSVQLEFRLVDREGSELWHTRIAHPKVELHTLPIRAARAVVGALNPNPGQRPRAERRTQDDSEAWTAFVQGRYHYASGDGIPALHRAAVAFQQAIDLAPDLAPAHAGLGDPIQVRGAAEQRQLRQVGLPVPAVRRRVDQPAAPVRTPEQVAGPQVAVDPSGRLVAAVPVDVVDHLLDQPSLCRVDAESHVARPVHAESNARRGIERIRIKPVTCSFVINYDPDQLDSHQIIQLLIDHHYFDESNAITHDEHVQNAAAKAGLKVGKIIFGWAVSKTLEANGLSMLAAII